MIALFYGGASSGKSSLAEDFAVKKASESGGKLCYVATMIPFGSEGERRVASHLKKREGKGFSLCEKYTDIQDAEVSKTVLLECVGNLVANEMFAENPKSDVCEYILQGIKQLSKKCDNLIIVSSDLSGGCENPSEETLEYIKNIEKINCGIANFADKTFRVCVGIAVKQNK